MNDTDTDPQAPHAYQSLINPPRVEPTREIHRLSPRARTSEWYDGLPKRVRRAVLVAYILLITFLLTGNAAAWLMAIFFYHMNQARTGQ